MHTYNEMEEVEDLLKNDSIYGVYTDYLSPDCMDSIPYPYVLEAEETQD